MTYSTLIGKAVVNLSAFGGVLFVMCQQFSNPLWFNVIGSFGVFVMFWMVLNWYRVMRERRMAINLSDRARWKSIPVELECQHCMAINQLHWTGNRSTFNCVNCGKPNGIALIMQATVLPDFDENDTLDSIARRKMLEILQPEKTT